MYKKLEVKSAIHWLEPPRFTPYSCDINPYRGCEHKCEYCYALYSHKFLDSENFYDDIFYKENIIQPLKKDLKRKKFKNQLIGVGTVCDAYQPIEKHKEITRNMLDVFIEYKTPIYISTKSNLILRDIDKISKLAQVSTVYIAITITTLDKEIASKIEPNVISPKERLAVAKELKEKTGAFVGLHIMPIIPGINDDKESIKGIFQSAKDIGLDFIHCAPLNLYTDTRIHFFGFLRKNFPEEVGYIDRCYSKSKNIREYQEHCRELTYSIRKEVSFFNKCSGQEWKEKLEQQLSLFDE